MSKEKQRLHSARAQEAVFFEMLGSKFLLYTDLKCFEMLDRNCSRSSMGNLIQI